MASSHVGELSGAFIPISKDLAMIEAVENGAFGLEKLKAMTSVCSVGLFVVPSDTPPHALAGLIADELAISRYGTNSKITGVRVIPAPRQDRRRPHGLRQALGPDPGDAPEHLQR